MPLHHSFWIIAGLIFVINMPFGFWRAGVRRFSVAWFAAIHMPVILAIGIRVLAGMPLLTSALPLFMAAFFLGQFAGGILRACCPADGG